jgi:hypothetical protein
MRNYVYAELTAPLSHLGQTDAHDEERPSHMHIQEHSLCASASHLQKRGIPASLTRLPFLGSVVEMYICGNNRC